MYKHETINWEKIKKKKNSPFIAFVFLLIIYIYIVIKYIIVWSFLNNFLLV